MEVHAADELAVGSYVNQPPLTVSGIHRIFIYLAEKMHSNGIRLGEVLEAGRIFSVLLVKDANGADVLIASPNGILLAKPPPFGDHVGRGRGGEKQQGGHHENSQKDGIAALTFASNRASRAHAGFGSSIVSVARRPVPISSISTLLLPICIRRNLPSNVSPTPMM